MSFIPETGDGLEDANSYVTVEFVDVYHSDRGRPHWDTLTEPVKEQCLIRATDYVEKRFGRRFRGRRRSADQALEWPRLDARDDDRHPLLGVPKRLQQAIAEYALRAALLGELAPDPPLPVPPQDLTVEDPASPPSGEVYTGQVSSKKEKVGPIEEQTVFQSAVEVANIQRNKTAQSFLVSDFQLPEYPAADLLLEELINTNAQRRLARG